MPEFTHEVVKTFNMCMCLFRGSVIKNIRPGGGGGALPL